MSLLIYFFQIINWDHLWPVACFPVWPGWGCPLLLPGNMWLWCRTSWHLLGPWCICTRGWWWGRNQMKWPQNIFSILPVWLQCWSTLRAVSCSGRRSKLVPCPGITGKRMCNGRKHGWERKGRVTEHPLQPGWEFWREKILHLVPGCLTHHVPAWVVCFKLGNAPHLGTGCDAVQ